MSDEKINSITASNYSITPELSCYGSKIRVKFNGSCLKQGNLTYTHEKIATFKLFMRSVKIVTSTVIQHWKLFVWSSYIH